MEWDLNQGMEHVIRKDQSFSKDEGLSMILKWILENKQAFAIMDPKTNETAPLTSLSTDFVCFRGLCTTIMCTPYEKREGWQLCGIKYEINQFHEKYFDQIPFFAISKMAKYQFLN